MIPKRSGGQRPLDLIDLADRALVSSLQSALGPVCAPYMSPICHSSGGRGVLTLLADLAAQYETGQFSVLMTLDVKNAFGSMPVRHTLDPVRRVVNDEGILRLIRILLGGDPDAVGIPQGLAISPMLLDLVLSDVFDTDWSDASDTPLVRRYVDDIPILCTSVYAGRTIMDRCRTLLRRVGLALKDRPEHETLFNLRGGDTAELLGFRISAFDDHLIPSIADAALNALRTRLLDAHKTNCPSLSAKAMVEGWINHVGPTFDDTRPSTLISDVLTILRRTGFGELHHDNLYAQWKESGRRWRETYLETARARILTP